LHSNPKFAVRNIICWTIGLDLRWKLRKKDIKKGTVREHVADRQTETERERERDRERGGGSLPA